MAQKESQTRADGEILSTGEIFLPMPVEFAEMSKQRIEDFVNAQTELLEKLQESNRQWFDRMQSEANLASEFASKLTAARSIPDAMTACQEWANRRFKMMAEDREHLLSDCQKFTETGAHLLWNGWQSKSSGLST